ncbi:MAG: FAD-dependent monooxygenase [Burkholderiales bacterium]
MRTAVIGGSLGGLTAALCLRDLGVEVDVYERSPVELAQRGAGIGFLPESARYLAERAGVALDTISIATSHIRYLDRRGKFIYDGKHRYRFSSWNTVYRQLLSCFGDSRYHLGHEMTGWEDGGNAVQASFAGKSAQRVDMLVCADGVGSAARARLLPEVRSSYAGYVAWRGMVAETSLDDSLRAFFDDAITYYLYANSQMLVYPIPGLDGSVKPGERLINFVWYRNYLEGSDLDDLLTDDSGQRREISLPPGVARASHVAELRAVANARLPEPMARVVCSTEQPFLQVVYDIEVPRMAFGRVCLVGDAAFVARPHAAAGTAKAAADAWSLADAIRRNADVPSALAQWEPGQLALGKQLLERNRRNGRRSQFEGTWTPGDPELIFGLRAPGV